MYLYPSSINQSSNSSSIIFFSFYLSIHPFFFSFPDFYLLQCFLFSGLIRFLLLANSSFTCENPFHPLQSPNSQRMFMWLIFSCLLIVQRKALSSQEKRWESPTVELNGSRDQLSAPLGFPSGYLVGLQ